MIRKDGLLIELNEDTRSVLITIEGNKKYYMSININSIDKLIVFSSVYFDNQWKQTNSLIQRSLANNPKKENDYKYKYAEEGFLRGIKNPVPLVNIYIQIEKEFVIPTLIDGLSRTNYLLANKAKWLVFNCSNQEVGTINIDERNIFIIEKEEI
jgi:hypothetical protein